MAKVVKYFLFCSIIFPVFAFSQQKIVEISGKVIDKSTLAPVIGASVSFQEGKIGTVTDLEGKFTLRVGDLPVNLSVTYLGYKRRDITVKIYSSPLNITLEENTNDLAEVVVVGYGTQNRREITGAIAKVDKTFLEYNTAFSVDGLLSGAVAGVNVTSTSGAPGSPSNIRIRGGNSINASNEPLYVIDGLIFYSDNSNTQAGMGNIESVLNPLATLNPADIESIEVLKDVSATAIYGSRGSNGVVIITTRQGKRGRNYVNYQYTFGVDETPRKLDLMDAQQWARFQNTYGYNYFSEAEIAALGRGSDWQNEILRTAYSHKHDISISGGDDNTRYLVSGSYIDQEGILVNTGFNRYIARVNLDRKLLENLKFGINLTGGKSVQNGATTVERSNATYQGAFTSIFGYAIRMSPAVPIYNTDGSYNYKNPYEKRNDLTRDGNNPNPVSDIYNSTGENINTSLLGNFNAVYTALPGLEAKVSLGTNINNSVQNFFAPASSLIGLIPGGLGGVGNKSFESYLSEYTVNYSKLFDYKHKINILAGYTKQDTKIRFSTTKTGDFSDESLGVQGLYAANSPDFPRTGGENSWFRSILGRINYSLLERYNLTATLRADESSKFAPGHRWGFFPSAGLSWNVEQEPWFWKNEALNTLKIRISYGVVGQQEIGDNLYLPSYTYVKTSDNNKITTSLKKARKGNPDLTWESTSSYNVGLDASLFDSRITVSADIYSKLTYNLLYNMPIESSEGFSSQMTNIGNITNRGFELSLSTDIIDRRDLQWKITANLAHNRNTVTDLGPIKEIKTGSGLSVSSSNETILRVGESLDSFYGLIFDGVVQTGEDVSNLPILKWKGSAPQPGDPKFIDVDGDGDIDADDRTILGSSQPDFIFGFSTNLKYKRLDFFASFQGTQGNRVYNRLRRDLATPGSTYNFLTELLDSWTENNPSNTYPRISQDIRYQYLDSRFVEDASYLRLKNIALGYTFPLKVGESVSPKVRIFVSAQNLFLLTKYKGYDPEIAAGIDFGGVYPASRTVSAGASLSF